MALIKWTKKYSVGVKAMDDQHIKLVEFLNELHAAMLKGRGQSVTDSLLKKLTDYTLEHFTDEKAMLEAVTYPGLTKQREEHREESRKLEEYVARYKQGDQAMYPQLLLFLDKWLRDHMLGEDKLYTAWMNDHGIR
ncbi:MAG: bacteriohemerythrin [Terracidiphilus sp.]|jgi:methyl-accepting chemotaxis protein/hemerythrin